MPVFQVDDLTFGIVICNDSTYLEPARVVAAGVATVLFVSSNNSLPRDRAHGVVSDARACDIARAVDNTVWVVRADVAGRTETIESEGATGVVDPNGRVVRAAQPFTDDLLIVDIDSPPTEAPAGVGRRVETAVTAAYRALVR